MEQDEQIKELIEALTVTDEVKTQMRQRLSSEGVTPELLSTIKGYIASEHAALTEEAEVIKAGDEELDQAYEKFDQEVAAVKEEADQAFKDASNEIDQIEMEEARSKIE